MAYAEVKRNFGGTVKPLALDEFRERLRKVMQLRGWTQRDLARALDVREATVSDWFNRNNAPGAETLLRMPHALGVDGHWLLTGEGAVERAPEGVKQAQIEAIKKILLGEPEPPLGELPRPNHDKDKGVR